MKASLRPFESYDLVRLTWIDSSASGGWTPVESTRDEIKAIESVGWIVAETKDALTIAASVGVDGGIVDQHCDALTIPKVAIRKRTILRPKRAR